MAKMMVECVDPNDLGAVKSAVEQAVGKCNITYFKHHQELMGAGKSSSQRQSAKIIALETGETPQAVRRRIQKGKAEVAPGGPPQKQPQKLTFEEWLALKATPLQYAFHCPEETLTARRVIGFECPWCGVFILDDEIRKTAFDLVADEDANGDTPLSEELPLCQCGTPVSEPRHLWICPDCENSFVLHNHFKAEAPARIGAKK